mmetsp:Transcript_18170/g.31504  ORF Transcript_18170/g.31504 Transcript_18170/m.31504 type:complete len:125 (+) Transcript_18170:113-487(+)|eukprot:CAMPEP_0184691958 /NCGR_PEP_ID=MMETSP0313-20130426/632_1 /TAXON_ID=2792 /ORGANISM="Porphyridium aerugineum, Strain SAG 1380-2" /LENGTH=124 /DNA_ID=CAMNT_0027149743 /DNA_START=98 /DNA_END=472 /DNA_ORIENTATION=-
MGSAVSMPACRRGPWKEGITHQQQVLRLYRQSIKTVRDWNGADYDLFINECLKLQAEFRANKGKTIAEGRVLVRKGMEKLLENRHPEPMIAKYLPGGTKFQRNVPPPPELCGDGKMLPPIHERL